MRFPGENMNGKMMTIVAFLVVAGTTTSALCAESTTKPAASIKERSLEATVVSVKGHCEKLVTTDGKEVWVAIKQGETLSELTIVRTGLRSEIVLKFADRGKVIVSSVTKAGISRYTKRGEFVRATIGLKYGRMFMSVDSTKGTNDFRVSTPVALLSIRGTSGWIVYYPSEGLRLGGKTGTWAFIVGDSERKVKPGEITDDQLTKSSEIKLNAQDNPMGDSFAISAAERRNMRDNGSGRGFPGLFGSADKFHTSPTGSGRSKGVGATDIKPGRYYDRAD